MTSASNMSQCHVRMVSATISSSVRINAVKVMDTTWIKSWSNRRRPPNIIIPPTGDRKSPLHRVARKISYAMCRYSDGLLLFLRTEREGQQPSLIQGFSHSCKSDRMIAWQVKYSTLTLIYTDQNPDKESLVREWPALWKIKRTYVFKYCLCWKQYAIKWQISGGE